MNSILLAGGMSTRFGSNKNLIKVEGEILINKIVNVLKNVFDRVYVIVNDLNEYSFLEGVELLEDIIPDKGPLGGLYTGLFYSTDEYNYLSASDMPFITEQYLKFLSRQDRDYDVLVPEYRGYIEPLAGIYSRNCLPVIRRKLEDNNLKIKGFYPEVKVKKLESNSISKVADLEKLFFNINNKEDLKRVKDE
jgi:molybdenum cofactor guanylyltransferase